MNTCTQLESYIDKIVLFVLSYRKDDTKSFKGWTEEQLRNEFRHAAVNCSMASVSDSAGNIIGVCSGTADYKKNLFFVGNILAKPGCMPAFIRMFDSLFPGFKLAGKRYGKEKHYDFGRFKQKFSHK